MNKLIILFCICFFFLDIISQWQPDVRLTNNIWDSGTTYNNARCVTVNGNIIHLVFLDNRDGNYEIYYKRSTDAGISWGPDTRLTNNSAPSLFFSVAVSGSIVHIVWQDQRVTNDQIYYKRSSDNGVSWGPDSRLTNTSTLTVTPSIAVSGNFVHVVWDDFRDINPEIYYKGSSDAGISWGTDTRLTNNSSNSLYPSTAVSGNIVHVVWHDERDGNYEIYYKRSSDGGISWGADTRLTNAAGFSWYSSASVSGSLVNVVWEDNRNGNYEIYYKHSTDGGISWDADSRLTNSSGNSWRPSAASSGSAVHVLWHDNRDGNYEIYYKRTTDGGISWDADSRLTNSSGVSNYPCPITSDSVVHVFWTDNRDGNGEIYYKRDPTGNPIGIQTISTEIPHNFSLSQNYPNPFNPVTKIRFSIPASLSFGERRGVRLLIYDLHGREVATLVNEQLKPGTYEAEWNAANYSSGVYFYSLITEGFTSTKKMILVK